MTIELPHSHDAILHDARRYKVINRRTEERHFAGKHADRAAREALASLSRAGLLRRVQPPTSECNTHTAPFDLPSEAGCAVLATARGDMSLVLDAPVVIRNYQDVPHYLAVTRLLMDFDLALAGQSAVELLRLWTEHCIINPGEPDAKKRRKLATEVGRGKRGGTVFCLPDACLIIRAGRHVRAYLVELETGSDNPSRVAAKKAPGYHLLQESGLFRQWHRDLVDFRVLTVTPSAAYRETLRGALRDKPGAGAWLVVSREDIDATGRFLSEPVFWPVLEEAARPLVRGPQPPAASPPEAPLAGASAGGHGTNATP